LDWHLLFVRIVLPDRLEEMKTLYCTRCGTPATRQYVQAIDDKDCCPSCGGVSWRTADAPPSVPYQLSNSDRDFLRGLGVKNDAD
jgi:hypothetical protein